MYYFVQTCFWVTCTCISFKVSVRLRQEILSVIRRNES
jgi:hypothetical protein